MKPSLADLATFVSIARHRSFKQASVELGVSPSAVSHALCQLESRLGLKLVNRTTRSVSLTEAGRQLHAQLDTVISQIDHAVESVQPFRDQAVGTLRISAARQGARLALAPLVAEFLRLHPCMRIEIHAEDRLANLVEDSFDAGVRLGEFVSDSMVAVPLSGKVRFAVAGAPAYFRDHAPPRHPHDLLEHDCVAYRFPTQERPYAWEFEQDGQALEIGVNARFSVDDMDVLHDVVLHGGGLGYLYHEQIREHVADGRLALVLEDWLPSKSGFFLYYPRIRNPSFGFRAFLDFLRDKQNRSASLPQPA